MNQMTIQYDRSVLIQLHEKKMRIFEAKLANVKANMEFVESIYTIPSLPDHKPIGIKQFFREKKGVVYERTPTSTPAERITRELHQVEIEIEWLDRQIKALSFSQPDALVSVDSRYAAYLASDAADPYRL